jgi:hypothetical protein
MNSALGFVCIAGVALGILYQKHKPQQNEIYNTRMYQAWLGTYENSLTNLKITMIRNKKTDMKKNKAWMSISGEDASVITRNFYLGNSNPSFTWKLYQEGLNWMAVAEETIVDGWNSIVKLTIEFRFQESKTQDEVTEVFTNILETNSIEWKKTLVW